MYTELKAYQYIISMLKKYGIKNMVLSAGSRNVPFVHSVEKDPFFNCYSVVDERSAGYFALGMAQEKNEPVLISCTASTASCNYYPPVAEAYYQNVPLIILTSDRDPRMLGQREDQMIDQVNMFDRHVKKSVNLPLINNRADEEFCIRLINEAFLELDHNGERGPVHINVPMDSYNKSFTAKTLPDVKTIRRVGVTDHDLWKEKADTLLNSNRIMVVCGQSSYVSPELEHEVAEFFKHYDCAVIVDHMSNIQLDQGLNTVLTFDENYISAAKMKEFAPDIVISFGGQVFSGLKNQLRKNHHSFKHWLISERGEVCDLFKGLDTIFECSPEYFFLEMNKRSAARVNDGKYYEALKSYIDKSDLSTIPYSNVYAIKNVVERIPSGSLVHLSINDSIRITNFFKMNKDVKVYSNIGTYGIDGCMSSFIGQSAASPDKPAYLIIGDLSFFYDMNALKINSLGKNVHILLLNNHGAAEFYYNGTWIDQDSDRHTSARHNVKAKGWIQENGIRYLTAGTQEEYDNRLNDFLTSDEAVVFEVFTEMSTDAETIHNIYKKNRPSDMKANLMRSAKEVVKKSIGQEKAKRILDAVKNNETTHLPLLSLLEVVMNKEPLRILQVIPDMRSGGAENFIMNLYRNIDREKIQFDFAVHYLEKRFFDDEIESLGGKIYRFSLRNNNRLFRFIRELNRFYKEHPQYTIVHCHWNSMGFVHLLVAKHNKINVRIGHSHNSSAGIGIKGKIKKLMILPYRYVTTKNFACSDLAGKFLFGKRSYTIIPNAVSTDRFSFDAAKRERIRSEYNIGENEYLIGHVGRFNTQKNHCFLIRIFDEIHQKDKNTKLMLLGEGELLNAVKQQVANLQLEDSVIFAGVHSNMEDYYSAMDMLLLPSLYEGLPLTVIEAQAAGLPIVCTDTITDECHLTDEYTVVSLDDPIADWAQAVLQTKEQKIQREVRHFTIKEKGYDSIDVAEKLADYYIESDAKVRS